MALIAGKGLSQTSGASRRAIQDTESMDSMNNLNRATNSTNYVLFDRVQAINNPGAVENNANAGADMQQIIQTRYNEQLLSGLVKVDKNSSLMEILASCGVVLVIGLLMVLIFGVFRAMYNYIEVTMLNSINYIARDMIFIIFVMTVFYIFSLYNAFNNFRRYVDVDAITVFSLITMFTWAIFGIYKILYIQLEVNRYDTYEAELPNRKVIIEEYAYLLEQKQKGHLLKKERKHLKEFKSKILYFVWRIDFTTPTFLPTVSETFFGEEFPFSEYLSLCFGKTLKQYLQLKNCSY